MKILSILFLMIIFGCQNNSDVLKKIDSLSKQTLDLENKISNIEKNQKEFLNEIHPPLTKYKKPIDLIREEVNNRWKWNGFYLESTFWHNNRDEVLKTLEIVDFQQNGRIGIAFIRYSVGTNIFRKIEWLIKHNEYWYLKLGGLNKYSADEFNDSEEFLNWVEKMDEKGDEWEKESAKMFFNRNE